MVATDEQILDVIERSRLLERAIARGSGHQDVALEIAQDAK